MNLQFGYNQAIPDTVTTAWGARWIYPDDIVWDRQDLQGPEKEKLKAWLNGGAIAKAREVARTERYFMASSSMGRIILYQDKIGIIVASPQASYGYLYVAAWLK